MPDSAPIRLPRLCRSVPSAAVAAAAVLLSAATATAQSVNFAKFQKVAASVHNSSYEADFATDGIANNFHSWRTGNQTGPHWLELSYPRPVTLASAHVYSGLINATSIQLWQDFKFQYHDGTGWIDIPGSTITGNTETEVNVIFAASATSDRFRLLGSDTGSRTLRELAMFPPNLVEGVEQGFPIGTDVTFNLARKRPTLASSIRENNFAKHAVDGYVDDASRWLCEGVAGETLEIDLIDSQTTGNAHLYSGQGADGINPAQNFALDYWDGGTWLPIPGASFAGNSDPALVIPFDSPVTTTKVRYRTTTGNFARVRELLLFPPRDGGYPLGQDVIIGPPPADTWATHGDSNFIVRCDISEDRRLAYINGNVVFASGGSGGRAAQAWQFLLNHRDGSYRIRHYATGLCLALNQISFANNNLVLLEPYSGLPHQTWRIEPVDATHYRILNTYSGLALQTLNSQWAGGNPMSVRTPDGSGLQRWRKTTAFHFPKKGIAASNNIPDPPLPDPTATWMSHSFPLCRHASWSYSWGRQRSTDFPYMGPDHAFNPTQWGNFNFAHGNAQGPIDNLRRDLQSNARPAFLIGFNEPDSFNQAGRSLDPANPQTSAEFDMQRAVNEAVRRWPRLEAMDVPLVSPSPAGAFNGWLDNFHTRTGQLGYRVDHTAIHIYRNPNITSFINDINQAYNNWGRPVWVKEFSVVRWSGTATWTHADNFNFLAEFLWRAESIPHLARYSLFQFRASDGSVNQSAPDPANAPRSNTYNIDGTLTAFGQLYAGWDGVTSLSNHKAYHLHNRQRYLRVRNPAAGNDTIASLSPETEATGVQWFLVPGTTANTVRICSTLDGRGIRFFNGTDVGLAAATNEQPQTEWRAVESQHGWFFIEHPNTNQRLRINLSGDLVMGPVSSTGNEYQWRLVVPAAPEPTAPPSAPAGLAAEPGDGAITLTWTAVENANFYRVRRASGAEGPWTTIAEDLAAASHTDEPLAAGSNWFYQVIAINNLGESPPSAAVEAGLPHPFGTYDGWAALAFAGAPPGTDISPQGNPDHDTLVNLLEFAFFTDPLAPGPLPFTIARTAGGDITLHFPWNRHALSHTWQIRHSAELSSPVATWPVLDPGTPLVTTEGDRDHYTVTPQPGDIATGFFVLEVVPAEAP